MRTLYLEKDFYDDIADLGWEYTAIVPQWYGSL